MTVLSLVFMLVSEYIWFSHISAIENQQAQIQQAQIRLQQENIELRQAGTHAAETMFALKLSGTKQTATITEKCDAWILSKEFTVSRALQKSWDVSVAE